MKRKLTTVEDAVQIPGRGLLVLPGLSMCEFTHPPGAISVELRKPDGTTAEALLSVSWLHVDPPPQELRWACAFDSFSTEEVPIGTEIWGEVPSVAPGGR